MHCCEKDEELLGWKDKRAWGEIVITAWVTEIPHLKSNDLMVHILVDMKSNNSM